MDRKLWVQHISGQGEKWEVAAQGKSTEWAVDDRGGTGYHYLPRSEYVPCDPPEQWKDVTGECEWTEEAYYELYLRAANGDRVEANCSHPSPQGYLYRVRKVRCVGNNPDWAFIVERRKS